MAHRHVQSVGLASPQRIAGALTPVQAPFRQHPPAQSGVVVAVRDGFQRRVPHPPSPLGQHATQRDDTGVCVCSLFQGVQAPGVGDILLPLPPVPLCEPREEPLLRHGDVLAQFLLLPHKLTPAVDDLHLPLPHDAQRDASQAQGVLRGVPPSAQRTAAGMRVADLIQAALVASLPRVQVPPLERVADAVLHHEAQRLLDA